MIEATCINVFRHNGLPWDPNNGKIKGYELQDDSGNIITVTSEQLKEAIVNNKISIRNITLTSDGRLVTKKITIPCKIDGLSFEDVLKLNEIARKSTRNSLKLKGKYEFNHMGNKQYMIEYEDIGLYKMTGDKSALRQETTPYDIICMIKYKERFVDNLEIMRETFNIIIDV